MQKDDNENDSVTVQELKKENSEMTLKIESLESRLNSMVSKQQFICFCVAIKNLIEVNDHVLEEFSKEVWQAAIRLENSNIMTGSPYTDRNEDSNIKYYKIFILREKLNNMSSSVYDLFTKFYPGLVDELKQYFVTYPPWVGAVAEDIEAEVSFYWM